MQVYFFNVNDWDFSYFITQPWRIANGWDAAVPFATAFDGGAFYAHHFTPIAFLLAPFVGLLPSPFTLAVLHACSAGLLAFVLPRLVRQIYRDFAGDLRQQWRWTAFFTLFVFFCFAPYLGAFRYSTHYTTLVTPFAALAVLCLHQRRFRLAALCCLLVLMAQERAAVGVFGIGMYAFLLLKQRRLGVCLCAVSCIWFFAAVKLALPLLRIYSGNAQAGYAFQGALQPTALLGEKAVFLGKILCATFFLPLCGRRAALAALSALPIIAVSLASNRLGMLTFSFHYQDIPSVFFLLSMSYGVLWIQRHLRAVQWKKLLAGALLCYCVVTLATATRENNPLVRAGRLLTNPEARELRTLNQDIKIFDALPENVMLYVQSGLGPRLALHKNRFVACRQILARAADEAGIVVFSPICGQYMLGGSYKEVTALADSLPGLQMVRDNGRLRIYVSGKLAAMEPSFVERLKKI